MKRDNKDGRQARHSGIAWKRQVRTRRAILLILLAYTALICAAALIIDARHVRFYMTGPEELSLEYGERYTEPGVYAVTAGNIFGESSKHMPVSSTGLAEGPELGSYRVEYTVKYAFRQWSTSRRVDVVDTTAPVLELKHVEGYRSSWYSGYQEEGFTAVDGHDGDISDKVLRDEREDAVVYTVTDSSGNTTSVERQLSYADTPPTISLSGGASMSIPAGLSFQEPGYSAADDQGTDFTDLVTVTGQVIPYNAGTYELSYSVENLRGSVVTATRTVTVVPVQNPDTVNPTDKTIYLTFDDGPGPYTGQLLDLLARYNVKASFFVTGDGSKYYDMIGRAYDEGHSIGVHTYSHNYRSIYSGEDAFFQDLSAVEEIVLAQTGSYTKLYRFPGGSSNTVSSFNPGIVTRLVKALGDLGYSYLDWTVASGDAGDPT